MDGLETPEAGLASHVGVGRPQALYRVPTKVLGVLGGLNDPRARGSAPHPHPGAS